MIGHSKVTLEELPYIPTMLNNPSIRGLVFGSSRAVFFLIVSSALAGAQTVPSDRPSQAAGPAGLAQPAGSLGTAAEKPAEPPTEAELLIDAAVGKLRELKSVAADLEQNVEMLSQKFSLKGRYLKAPDHRVYLRLAVSGLPESTGTMLQICDGETLWDYQQVLENQRYVKTSIKPILERLNSPDLDPRIRDRATVEMGFAGPEALLVGLRRVIKFEQKETGALDGRKVLILRGTWANRQGLVLPNNQPVPPTGALPFYVPSDATLYLGADDSWPYKLVMIGRPPTDLIDTRMRGADNRVSGSKRLLEKPNPSRIELVYTNVKLNPTIKLDEFAFTAPPQAQVEDTTEMLVKSLDAAIEREKNLKRSEAAKKDGDVLEKSISVPGQPAETPAKP